MPLQGKLSIGLLAEDNPYKSYFVYKPLYVKDGEVYRPFEDPEKLYPEEGAIRIVPDKNEMNTFKARMRKIGAMCMMDLRKFPSENNKIRPNKNYSRELGEKNQFIVYSDVLTPLSPSEFAEVVDAPGAEEEQLTIACGPLVAETVALRREGRIFGPYHSETLESGEIALRRAEGEDAFTFSDQEAESRLIRIQFESGERLILSGLAGAEAPLEPLEAPESAPERPADVEKESAKPWITHDESIAPAPARGFLNTRDQFIAAQSGLNPRRGRSLSEVIDDQWRKSRIDQLGHPIPSQTAGRPALSPVDRAMEAVTEVWRIREARPTLLNHLVSIFELRETLKEYFTGSAQGGEKAAFEAALNEFEANRLKLAMEIDELRMGRDELYEKLMVEVRARNASEVSALERQKEELLNELKRLESAANTLETRVRGADAALIELFGEKFDERLAAKIFEDRTLLRLSGDDDKKRLKAKEPVLQEIEKDALVERVDAHLKRSGFSFAREEVINLLILFAIGDAVVLSGAPGAGHGVLAEVLAGALGARLMHSFASLDAVCGELTVVMLDNVNGSGGSILYAEALKAAARAEEGIRVFAAANDAPDGNALPQRLLNASYFVRIKPPPLETPWQGCESQKPGEAISIGALINALKSTKEIPAQIEMKLLDIRASLANAGYLMGREMLAGLWRYCALGAANMELAPLEVLDFALAQRALPAIMATMEPRVLRALASIFSGMPRCKALMEETIPIF